MCRFGLVSISFRNRSPAEIIQAAKAAGLGCVEWGSDLHAPPTDVARLREIAALQREAGIVCCSYGTYFRLGVTPFSELNGYIDAAQALGTDVLRLWCGDKGSANYRGDEKNSLFAECRRAAALAERRGVKLCMECHIGTYTDAREAALELMQAVDSPHFRMYWQPNQWKTEAENIDYARALASYTEHLHVFHWRKDRRFPLRDGLQSWKNYLACFDKSRTLLLEFMPDDKMESLPTEARTLFALGE